MNHNMIPLSGMDTLEFVPPPFDDPKTPENPPTFLIRIPTFAIRDKLSAVFFERGLVPATLPMGRAKLINALYELYDEEQAEAHGAFLEDFWTKAEVHQELVAAWQMREAQRLFDFAMGVRKDIAQEPLPPAPFTMRDQARQAQIVSDALERCDDYRMYQARFMVAQEEEDEMTVRLFLRGWRNCGDAEAELDSYERLTPECIERVRTWLRDQGAPEAWDAVKTKVKEQFGGPGRLEKNFASPLDTNSNRSGSLISSGDLETSDGSSTTSSIERTPSTSLPATSVASRNSRSGKSAKSKAAPRKRGRTGGRS